MKKILFLFFLTISLIVRGQVKDTLQLKYYYARKYLYHDNWKEAEKISNYLLKIDSLNPKYHYLHANVCISGKRFDSAKISIDKAYILDLSKDSLKYFSSLEFLFSQFRQYDSAKYYINKIIKFKTDSAKLYKERSFYNLMLKDTTGWRVDLIKAANLGDKGAQKTLRMIEGKESL